MILGFQSKYRETSGDFGEADMLWESARAFPQPFRVFPNFYEIEKTNNILPEKKN